MLKIELVYVILCTDGVLLAAQEAGWSEFEGRWVPQDEEELARVFGSRNVCSIARWFIEDENVAKGGRDDRSVMVIRVNQKER